MKEKILTNLEGVTDFQVSNGIVRDADTDEQIIGLVLTVNEHNFVFTQDELQQLNNQNFIENFKDAIEKTLAWNIEDELN